MPCYRPFPAYRRDDSSIAFHEKAADREALSLACKRCIGCRLDRARDWAIRCSHEAKLWTHNITVHLTYDDKYLDTNHSLNYVHVQNFLKRLRKKYTGIHAGPTGTYPLRYFVAGEYGDQTLRPHYHMLLYNFTFTDGKPWSKGQYKSEELERLWGKGMAQFSDMDPERCAYVARYALKKVYGRDADLHYDTIDPRTGEVFERVPEFAHMSNRPGLGKWWIDRFPEDFRGREYIISGGHKVKTPSYYERKFAETDELEVEAAKHARYMRAKEQPASERSPQRLHDKEHNAYAKLATKAGIKRGF